MKPDPDNLVPFPTTVLTACDLPDTNSGKTKSLEEKTQSTGGKIAASEVPYEVKNQPTLPAQLQKDLIDLTNDQLAKAYPSEYGSYHSRKGSLKKQGLTMPSEFSEFRGFLAHIGINPYPGHYTVHRIDNDNPNYFPGGIKWASKKEQNNAKGDTIKLTIEGETKPLTVWLDLNPDLKENSVRSRWRKRDEKGYTDCQVLYGAKTSPSGSMDSPGSPQTPAAIGCKSTPDGKDDSSPGPFSKPSCGAESTDIVKPESNRYIDLFQSEVENVYDETVIGLTEDHEHMLKRIANLLSQVPISSIKAIRLVIRLWPMFTKYADENYGIYKPPLKPTPEYLARAVRAVPSFYQIHRKRLEKSERENDPKVWKKLLKGYGKKFRKQAENEYIATRTSNGDSFENRTEWLNRYANSMRSALEHRLSTNWASPDPVDDYEDLQWCKVLRRTTAMLNRAY